MWLKNQRIQQFGGGRLERTGIAFVSAVQLLAMGSHKDKPTLQLIKRIRHERKSLLTAFESFIVVSLARAQSKRPGAMAEVGVFEGGSARLICEAKGEKVLHLFDTFEGLPKATAPDRQVHRLKQFASSLESVQAYLQDFPNVYFHKGLFPESAAAMEELPYGFVHFDVDLYESTRACLEYFYPKMIPGGIMLSHDYSMLTGVKKAFDEFIADKPEGLIELPTTQCMLVKL